MRLAPRHELPPELQPVLRRAIRLEIATLVYMTTVIVLMGLVMGSSQAMKAAWIEDLLTLIPPLAFLITVPLRHRRASARFPFGHHRTVSIAFLTAALALFALGLTILADSVRALALGERPSIGTVTLLGEVVWLGWVMIPVLVYSAVGAVILGYLKLAPARALHDKTLHTDAAMNKADWLTALAAVIGVLGVGLGWWWADSVAAIVIALDVTKDGARATVAGVQDLMDRAPERVDHSGPERIEERVVAALEELPWVREAEVRIREGGHVLFTEAFVVLEPEAAAVTERLHQAAQRVRAVDWRLVDVVIQPVEREDLARPVNAPRERRERVARR